MKFISSLPIVLASASPRRAELLQYLHVPFEIVPSEVEEENVLNGQSAVRFVKGLAAQKAADVAKNYPSSIVIGADTVVVLDGYIYPKPEDAKQAKKFLQQLSGRTHSVITAVCVHANDNALTFSVETKVTFYELQKTMIDAYIDSGDPFDKAGGYGIQTAGALFVEKIEGDYFAVVGLPVAALARHLQERGLIFMEEGEDQIDD